MLLTHYLTDMTIQSTNHYKKMGAISTLTLAEVGQTLLNVIASLEQ